MAMASKSVKAVPSSNGEEFKDMNAGSVDALPDDEQTPKPKRTASATRTITYHYFEHLLPYGLTTLKDDWGKWSIRCGRFYLTGHGGSVEWIVRQFLDHVVWQTQQAANEALAEKFGDGFKV